MTANIGQNCTARLLGVAQQLVVASQAARASSSRAAAFRGVGSAHCVASRAATRSSRASPSAIKRHGFTSRRVGGLDYQLVISRAAERLHLPDCLRILPQ